MAGAVYLHIPFCQRLCPYCDFTKYVLKGQPVEKYLGALSKEMAYTFSTYPSRGLHSIFVGGGTPTTLSTEQMRYFLQQIECHLQPQNNKLEFTMEANPECVDQEKLAVMFSGGVNRLSFGVQAFQDHLLKRLGRMHSQENVFQAIQLAKEVGFQNISIDLMFGLPGQTVADWEETLEMAFSLDIPHFSAYGLKIEEGTFFHTLEQKNKLLMPTEEVEVEMYELLMKRMSQAGYNQYEISNFARPGYESVHNLTYWRNEEYYGLGAGAHGYVYGVRHENHSDLSAYIQAIEEKDFAWADSYPVSKQEAMENMLIMGLRTRQGVSNQKFQQLYKVELSAIYGDELKKLLTLGLVETDGEHYFLSKKGILLGNEVFAYFLTETSSL